MQLKYVESFSPRSTLSSDENHEALEGSGARHLEGRSSGSDVEGYESVNHCERNKDDDISVFKREPARKSLKSDHLDRWIDMQESYSEVRASLGK